MNRLWTTREVEPNGPTILFNTQSLLDLRLIICVLGILLVIPSLAQRSVSGLVTNPIGEPLIGATITLKDGETGTLTDENGYYQLAIGRADSVLVFSFMGFKTKEIYLSSASQYDVSLEETISTLSEVVVTGYGSQIRSTLTGNIARVTGAALKSKPVSTIEQALQGQSAGVLIQGLTGKPNGIMRILIRGSSSISAGNQPLFVIDGIPLDNARANLSGAQLSPLADLNFNDVASVEILKDASAAAIYGSRASNGVVLISTKSGLRKDTKVELDYQWGLSSPTNKREFLNAAEYQELFLESARNLDEVQGNSSSGFNWLSWMERRFDRHAGPSDWRTGEADTNWQDLAFSERSPMQQASLSIAGGSDKTRFYSSLGFTDHVGILISNRFQRKSGRLNIDHEASKNLSIGVKMSLAHTFTHQVSNDGQFENPMQLVAQMPITPDRNYSGVVFQSGPNTIQPGELIDTPTAAYYNNLIEGEDSRKAVSGFRSLASTQLTYRPLKGLSLHGELAVDLLHRREDGFYGSRTRNGQAINGLGFALTGQRLNYNTKLYGDYQTISTTGHRITLTAGLEFQASRDDRSEVIGQDFPLDALRTLASAADISFGSSSISESSFLSYFTRLNYNYQQRYLLTLSSRIDGSSKFGQAKRYGWFPAASLGWVVSRESFLSNSRILSFMKLRASYGLTGNAFITNFRSLGLYAAESYNNESGLQPTQLANPDLSWESTLQWNLGLHFGLFDDRLSGEIDVYNRDTRDLLLNVQLPYTSGFSSQLRNIGRMENKGIELVVYLQNLVGEFSWKTSLNMAWNRNEVKALANEGDIVDPNFLNAVKVGHPLGVFYGVEYAGVDPANGDALFYLNQEGQERATTNDFNQANFTVIGNPHPDWFGGITNTFQWKGLSLDLNLQVVFGHEIHNYAGQWMSCQACWLDNQTKDQLDRWQKPGDQTVVPKAILFGGNGDQWRSSRYLSDGSYLRLKTLSLAYDWPATLLRKIKIKSLRLYLSGQNLWTLTNYDGWDPEVSTDVWTNNVNVGSDFYSVPQAKTIVFGVKVGF